MLYKTLACQEVFDKHALYTRPDLRAVRQEAKEYHLKLVSMVGGDDDAVCKVFRALNPLTQNGVLNGMSSSKPFR